MLRQLILISLVITTIAVSSACADDPFALGVRETPHLSPAEEQKLFKLPPGFEIQLIAAEPEIQKPLNLAFDAKGGCGSPTRWNIPMLLRSIRGPRLDQDSRRHQQRRPGR